MTRPHRRLFIALDVAACLTLAAGVLWLLVHSRSATLVRFDGQTTSGWVIEGDADVLDGALVLGGNQKTWARVADDFDPTCALHLEYSTENNRPIHRQAGLSESTVYRRLADPAFCAKRDQLRADMVQRTSGALTAAGTEAVRTLLELMKPSTSSGTRLGAARSVLEIGIKVREVQDLQQRIAAIEEQLHPGPRLASGTAS